VLNKDEGKGMSWQERRHQWLHDEVYHFPMTLLGPRHFGKASLVRHFPQKPNGAASTFKTGADGGLEMVDSA